MGVESGGTGGRVPPPSVEKSAGDVPPRNEDIFIFFFLNTYENFAFSNIFKIKRPKSEEKLNFGGRWVWVPMNPSAPPPPKQNFVATPQSSCCIFSPQVRSERFIKLSVSTLFNIKGSKNHFSEHLIQMFLVSVGRYIPS